MSEVQPHTDRVTKVDLKKTLPRFAARRGRIDVIEVPAVRYLAADATGAPGEDSFASAIEALYPLAYAIKFVSKAHGRDYVVPPLEALWWADDMAVFTSERDPSQWKSTVLLMLPDWIGSETVEEGRAKAARKLAPPQLERVRVEVLQEGTAAQTLHIGPFSDEGPVIEALHARIADDGLTLSGKHHEIYLSDFRKTAPERLRTILRQPAR
ncbi:GyrI-like domain-containing protein [Demequina sediminicola]|uniref:GyrI-like domain-containing protein n=1 Tax=Demequina sediminicola TaxID=1095026 RepID=UPI0007804EEC|nr:GyrI-like domain-containing protein [Demequina sediminicola]